MEISDFRNLSQGQKNNELRKPNCLKHLTDVDISNKLGITNTISQFLEMFGSVDGASAAQIFEKVLRRNFKVTGNGVLGDPFVIKTRFGSGSFLHFNSIFKKGDVPKYFQKRMCHQNAYLFARDSLEHCEILSGICYRNFPFLHSVVLSGEYVLDFNYDLAMSKDLYLKLFNFEVLNRVKSEDIKKSGALIRENGKFFVANEITYGDIVFCFYEIMESMKKQEKSLSDC